jgi:hypothetical protein
LARQWNAVICDSFLIPAMKIVQKAQGMAIPLVGSIPAYLFEALLYTP